MQYLQSYIKNIENDITFAERIEDTANEFSNLINSIFDYRSHIKGFLLSDSQTDKFGQIFGIISKMADEGFRLFIILTTNNVPIQRQVYEKSLQHINDFEICSESDDIRFRNVKSNKPILLILKKNTNVLKRWKDTLTTSNVCKGEPLVILDDEADAASLNTLVNRSKVSQINSRLNSIKKLAASSIYIQVTATPQSVILQSNISEWKPEFVHYFNPGSAYIGGDFIYSSPVSYCIKLTEETEFDDIKMNNDIVPLGLRDSLLTFLVICAEFQLQKKDTCNFLVHPSVRISDHEQVIKTLGENLNTFLAEVRDEDSNESFFENLYEKWLDVQKNQPDINAFDDIKDNVEQILDNQTIELITLNSKTPVSTSYNKGFNIIVGGNSLGRGVTFKNLQVVYYCRKSKQPQADTFWQHSRVFGYDRIKGLIRVFLPPSLHELFTALNNSNKILIEQIKTTGLENLQLIYPEGIKPTRKNVLDNKAVNIIVGGVNFFARNPSENPPYTLDNILYNYLDEKEYHEVPSSLLLEVLANLEPNNKDWSSEKYKNCVLALTKQRPLQKFALVTRRNRNISKGTGTLLSQIDRKLTEKLNNHVVLVVYRVNGETSQNWKGQPFWIPNIRFPDGLCFYDTIDI
ncbi:MAG: hypothetical protein RLZZ292_3337 [Bacteroidota bacterium]|jgi:hypothetical protein